MARIFAVLIISLALAACAAPQVMEPWDLPVRTGIALEGVGKERIYDLTRVWLERNFVSTGPIIEYADRDSGVIIADDDMEYPAAGELEAMQRIQYTISFRLRAEASDGRLGLVFYDLLVNVPKAYDVRDRYRFVREYSGGYSRPPAMIEEYEAAKRGYSTVVEKLKEYLSKEGRKGG